MRVSAESLAAADRASITPAFAGDLGLHDQGAIMTVLSS